MRSLLSKVRFLGPPIPAPSPLPDVARPDYPPRGNDPPRYITDPVVVPLRREWLAAIGGADQSCMPIILHATHVGM